jgi:hypothetical protein
MLVPQAHSLLKATLTEYPNGTIYPAAPYSIDLPVNATYCAHYRQVPSVLINAGPFHR